MTDTAQQIKNTSVALNRAIKATSGIFDPRIHVAEDESKAMWNSESVELANKGIADGYKLKESPYLRTVKDAKLRKGNLPFKYTPDELAVFEMCMNDKVMFGNNFVHLKDGEDGWKQIKLRSYQELLLDSYTNQKWNIIMFPRQSGKTTTTVVEIVHFCCFNFDKDCVVIAQSDMVVMEILNKIKEAFSKLPFFLQPGFISFNAEGFTLDNGCRLRIGIAKESVVQGFALDFLFIDEFAYIANSRVNKFWNNIYPALTNNPKSKCIIASTPNGRNMFYELWQGAITKSNRFHASRIYWYDVPRKQSQEEFKADTIANVGIEGWEMGFECSFDTQLKSIFNVKMQKHLRGEQRLNKEVWALENNFLGEEFNISFKAVEYFVEKEIVNRDGDTVEATVNIGTKYDLRNDYFLIAIDLAEGLGQDCTVMKIRKIEWDKKRKLLIYKNVGVFRSNEISVEDFAEMNLKLFKYFDLNKTRVVVETNNYGGEYFSQIDNLAKFVPEHQWFDNIIFAKFDRDSKKDFERGIRWNASNKKTSVKAFSNFVTKEIFDETHYQSVEEYLNFGKNANDTYAAQYGNDDCVMVDVTASAFLKSGNMYATEFLLNAESDLRTICRDLSLEVLAEQKKIADLNNNIHNVDGWYQRNSELEYNARHKRGSKAGNGHYLL